MLEDFLSYIESNLSINHTDKLLLSVSGGVDSMVMLHLFSKLNYNFAVAHINHSTRNGASDRDMDFVASVCKTLNIQFFSKTLDYTSLNKGNFQENARNERFEFLLQLKKEHAFTWIATAHHQEDRWETFIMNLSRKSGLQGLTSLNAKQNSIIHPLLIFTKTQILEYSKTHGVEFVHDASNDSNDYLRNTVRNRITPIAKDIFPDFISNVNQSISNLESEFQLFKELIKNIGFVSEEKVSGHVRIDLKKVLLYHNSTTLLYHLIEKYGFNFSDSKDMLNSMSTGALFQNTNFEALIDRGKLIIRQNKKISTVDIEINSPGRYALPDSKYLKVSQDNLENSKPELWLDIHKITWPLLVRNIKPGDKFKPHGMRGATKSIKKLCTDLKISRFAKESLLVVCKDDTIVQVIGLRTSHNYNTTDIKNAVTFKIVE